MVERRDNQLDTSSDIYKWFRWVPRGFLIMASIVPLLFILWSYRQNQLFWVSIIFYLPILAIVITAWVMPMTGGIITIVIGSLVLFWLRLIGSPAVFNQLFFTIEFVLIVTGGILSIIWGHLKRKEQTTPDLLDTETGRRGWFKWPPRFLLLMAAIMPILLVFWGLLQKEEFIFYIASTIPLLVIVIIEWVEPIIGGITAIVMGPSVLLLLVLFSGYTTTGDFFFLLECVLLLIGGILSIIWGVQRRRWRHNQAQITTTTGSR